MLSCSQNDHSCHIRKKNYWGLFVQEQFSTKSYWSVITHSIWLVPIYDLLKTEALMTSPLKKCFLFATFHVAMLLSRILRMKYASHVQWANHERPGHFQNSFYIIKPWLCSIFRASPFDIWSSNKDQVGSYL